MTSFAELGNPRDLGKIFETVDSAQWRSFRSSESARYAGLVLPRILVRLPYGERTNPVEEFTFSEAITGPGDYLFGNAVYALGTVLARAFAKYHWCAAIRGAEGVWWKGYRPTPSSLMTVRWR